MKEGTRTGTGTRCQAGAGPCPAAPLADTALVAALTLGATGTELFTEVPLIATWAALLASPLALAGLVRGGLLGALGLPEPLQDHLRAKHARGKFQIKEGLDSLVTQLTAS